MNPTGPAANSVRGAYQLGCSLVGRREGWERASALDYVAVGYHPWLVQLGPEEAGAAVLRWLGTLAGSDGGQVVREFTDAALGRSKISDNDPMWSFEAFNDATVNMSVLDEWDDGAHHLVLEDRHARIAAGQPAVAGTCCAADVLAAGLRNGPAAHWGDVVAVGLEEWGLPADTELPSAVTDVLDRSVDVGFSTAEAVALALTTPEAYTPIEVG